MVYLEPESHLIHSGEEVEDNFKAFGVCGANFSALPSVQNRYIFLMNGFGDWKAASVCKTPNAHQSAPVF